MVFKFLFVRRANYQCTLHLCHAGTCENKESALCCNALELSYNIKENRAPNIGVMEPTLSNNKMFLISGGLPDMVVDD